MKNERLLLGGHISVAGGLYKAFERAESINSTCMQIFTKSNRQWHARPLTPEEISLFLTAQNKSSISPVITHAAYLINIGADNELLEKKSVEALSIELQRCQELAIPYLVLHPGARGKDTIENCLKRIGNNLQSVLDKNPGKTMILLENTAGQGAAVGHTFEQLATIASYVRDKHRIGYCLDTCHAFAAGYDFSTQKAYEALWQHFDTILGIENLKALHINDSKKPLHSCVDRHAEIGKGFIGKEAFKLIFNDPRFFNTPKILETPQGKEGAEGYVPDMTLIIELLSPATKKRLLL